MDTLRWVEYPNCNITSSSAIAEAPRDALGQLKSCQLLHNWTKNHICKGLQSVN